MAAVAISALSFAARQTYIKNALPDCHHIQQTVPIQIALLNHKQTRPLTWFSRFAPFPSDFSLSLEPGATSQCLVEPKLSVKPVNRKP